MGVLNHIFGGRKGLFKELFSDSEKLLKIWNDFIEQSQKKDSLSSSFSYKNVDNALQDISGLNNVLTEINNLILKEIIDIEGEKKLESEVISDLKRLTSHDVARENERLRDKVINEEDVQKNILKIFNRLYDLLNTELHTIKIIKEKLSSLNEEKTGVHTIVQLLDLSIIKGLLLQLFELLSFQEHKLILVFKKTAFNNTSLRSRIDNITKSVLLQEELKEEILSAEEKFVNKMKKGMVDEDSDSAHRKLAVSIFSELTEEAGAPFSNHDDAEKGLADVEKMVKDDKILMKIIKKYRPKYDATKLQLTMQAFRKAYEETPFEGAVDLYT